jgi:hypothetical protein
VEHSADGTALRLKDRDGHNSDDDSRHATDRFGAVHDGRDVGWHVAAPCASGASSSISTTKFGTLPSPCGNGHATGATDQGVTNTTINLAYGDDRGYSGIPGLDQEMGDAVKDMIAWCDAQGGINGRKIVGDFYGEGRGLCTRWNEYASIQPIDARACSWRAITFGRS